MGLLKSLDLRPPAADADLVARGDLGPDNEERVRRVHDRVMLTWNDGTSSPWKTKRAHLCRGRHGPRGPGLADACERAKRLRVHSGSLEVSLLG